MIDIKSNLLKLAYWVLIVALLASGGCVTSNDHQMNSLQPLASDRTLSIGSVQSGVYDKDKPVSLIVGTKAAGYLLCFYQDQTNSSVRLYPQQLNESQEAYVTKVTKNAILELSGRMSSKLTKSPNDLEKVACFLTPHNVSQQLLIAFKQVDILPYDISKIKTIFGELTKDDYHYKEVVL